ncbi:MAG: ABC transporter ATP-binding protein [Candidatus Omnitrophota bacterium]
MLEFRNVTSGYHDTEILKGISFNIEKGDFVGIIGPNGSGKSTLLKTATKIIKISKGEVLLEGKPINEISLREMSTRIAIVPQDTLFMFPFKVMDIVLMGRIPFINDRFGKESKKDLEIAEGSLRSVDALHLRDRYLDELSGGERQRVIIAKALAQEPAVLFLDEPTTHLDIQHQVDIFSLLSNLNREKNITVIAIMHDLNLASSYCNDLILLSEGRVKKQGTPQEVLDYKIIEEVYKTVVIVKDNPISKRPHVFLVKQERKLFPN